MARKKKAWLKRFLGVTLAAALVVQPLPATLGGIGVVHAEAGKEEKMTELIANGDFSDVSGDGSSAANWELRTEGETTAVYEGGKVVFNLRTMGADWSNYLKYVPGIDLQSGQDYVISFTVTSSADRIIQYGFDGGRMGIAKAAVVAGEEKVISSTYTAGQGYEKNPFMIYLGNIDEETNPTDAHTVEISNISIKTSAAGAQSGGEDPNGGEAPNGGEDPNGGEAPNGGEDPNGNEYTKDGDPVAPVEGNLLQDGNFENKNSGNHWGTFSTNAQVYFNKYRTVFHITGEAADWGQGLYQNVSLTAGATYKVSFDVETTVARTITVDMNDIGREFTSAMIPANTKTTISYTTSDVNNGDNKFFIYLGGVPGLGEHDVVISNVSIIEMPVELPNTPNDVAPAPLTSLAGLSAEDAVALKDGSFTAGLENWVTWCENWMATYNVVKYTPVENGMSVWINNTGGGEGNKAYDVQMNQYIDLKAGLQYTISFDVHTEKARAFNILIDELGTGEFLKPIGLQKNETRHVVLNIPVQSQDALNKLFSIQMGKVTGDVQQNTLTFTNMKIEVNGYEDLAILIEDGDFTEGLGSFELNDATDGRVENGSVIIDVNSTASSEDARLCRSGLNLKKDTAYTVSFVAGAVSGNRTIMVQLPDGTNKNLTLTDEATQYTVEFTPDSDVTNGTLAFAVGGAADTICLDTVRLDVKGFAEAKGLNVSKHDITKLTKKKAPVITEQMNAVVGTDVVLTFADADGEYTAAINANIAKGADAILVDGVAVNTDKYTVEQGKITLDKSLFHIEGDSERQTFRIKVNAYWYEASEAIQIVYAEQLWRNTFADEFDGTELNMENWSYQNGTGAEYGLNGWGNNEEQYYTNENLKVESGELVITATSEDRGGKSYSSARIWTMNDDQKTAKFSQTYGRFEAKMKLPAGEGYEGLWPAFWLLPVDSPYGGWPVSGEIDIMEARGREPDRMDSTLHFGRNYPNEATAGSHYGDDEDEELDITEYHIYSVDWTPTYMSFQVDGEEFYRVENWYCQDESEPQQYAYPAPFDQEFYIVLNMAVGGMYDNYLKPSEDVLPAEMKVDYVRVYQSTELEELGDDYIAPDPEMEKDMNISDSAKLELIDSEFENVLKVTTNEQNVPTDGWKLLTLPEFGGAADFETVEIDGETFAKIKINNVGNADYSIQMTQSLSLHKGHWYTLSFDAKADEARSLISKIGTDGSITNKWATFNAITTKLTKDVKHYEYTFQMLSDSDEISRLELNMGAGGTAAIYLANIEFKEVDGYYINPDVPKSPLENGNHIYNGAFNLGNTSRMAYWQVTDETSGVVRQGTEYNFRSKNATDLYQTSLELLQADTYELTFEVKADAAQDMNVIFSDREKENVYCSETISVNTNWASKTVTFTMPKGVTDTDSMLTFKMGEGVELDNVVMKRTTYNNVNYDGLNCYPLPNGDFEMGSQGWSTYQTSLTIVEDGDNHFGRVNGTTFANRYDSVLSYGGLELVGGYDYELTFKAKASAEAEIDVALETEDGNYTRHFQRNNIVVGTDWETYTYDFKLSGDQTLALKFLTGAADNAYDLDIDNIVLKMKGAPQNGGSFMPNAYNKLGEEAIVRHSGTVAWRNNAVVRLDGVAISGDLYTWGVGEIIFDPILFTKSGAYTLSATAEGYSDTTPVTIMMYPANGDRIANGDFDSGNSAWSSYIHGVDSAILNTDNGYLAAGYLHAEGDEWGNPSVPWSIQWNQKVTVDKAGNYDISFVAFSEVERYIMLSIADQTAKVRLTNEPTVHKVSLPIKSTGEYELQLQLGTVHPNVENGYFPAEDFVDFEAHNFYLDSISMLPAGTEVDKSNSELYGNVVPVIRHKAAYTVKHYQQNTAQDGYVEVKADTEALDGVIGDTVKAEANTYTGFTYDASASTPSGEVLENGSLVLKLYYTRNSYDVTYENMTGATNPNAASYVYGVGLTLEAATKEGFIFGGWYSDEDCTEEVTAIGTDAVGAQTVYAKWTAEEPDADALLKAFVERMYTVALGRDAEESGVNYWVEKLTSGTNDGEDIAHGFFDGKEFQSRELTDAEYIGILYGTFFNRTPVEEEVSYYEGLLENGATRDTLLNNFIASSEFDTLCTSYGITSKFTQEELVTKFVERMYTVALGREAEEDGTSYWVELLISKQKDGEDVAKGFFNGKEFIGRNLSDEDYVQTLYGTFFDRTAGESEVSYYLEQLQKLTRDDVLNSFINSAEFAALCDEYEIVAIFTREILVSNFVERLYTEALGRTAAAEEIGYYAELLLDKTITGTAAADMFISSTEFEERGLSDRDYITTLYKTFFNRVPSEADMEYWLNALAGNGRRPVLIGFANSGEFAQICADYQIEAGTLQ